MKVSKEQAAANRAAIVDAAERLFRERGFGGVGVVEITRAAGLTHGGFYGHFDSKDALAAEACSAAFAKSRARAKSHGSLRAFVSSYLSEEHCLKPENGCPMAAYVTEVSHQAAAVQATFAGGLERLVGCVEGLLRPADPEARRSRAIALASALVGGMALARAVAKTSPALSTEILGRLRTELMAAFGDGAASAGSD